MLIYNMYAILEFRKVLCHVQNTLKRAEDISNGYLECVPTLFRLAIFSYTTIHF